MKPRIAITMGDPAGVGPELCLRALVEPAVLESAVPVVIGDGALLHQVAQACGLPPPGTVVDAAAWKHLAAPTVVHVPGLAAEQVVPGRVDAETGAAAYRYITTAIDAALAGRTDAICTAPIQKEAVRAAGIMQAGHTEILAERTGAERVCMMLTSERITVSLVTTHVGMVSVAAGLGVDRVTDTIELTAEVMRHLRGREPRLVVCGLNPHAGEGGLFGRREEEELITPAVDKARANGLQIIGPLPPDTAFVPERLDTTDAFICMYHDQGLIPLKLLAFDRAVNVTLGLPIIRTSVDHGTALDLAWRGEARSGSMFGAIRLAARLSHVHSV